MVLASIAKKDVHVLICVPIFINFRTEQNSLQEPLNAKKANLTLP